MVELEVIAEGRTAEIIAHGDGLVVKLLREGFHRGSLEREAVNTRIAHESGYRVPAVGEMVEINGRPGIVFERVDGPSLLTVLFQRPWRVFQIARLVAELHAEMHTHSGEGLRPVHDRLERNIGHTDALTPAQKEGCLAALKKLEHGSALLHGDFHPDNILMTDKGPIIIDWIDANVGLPAADVARTTLLSTATPLPDIPFAFAIDLFRRLFHAVYLRHYLKLNPIPHEELARWMLPVAAARLAEEVPGERETLLRMVEERLQTPP